MSRTHRLAGAGACLGVVVLALSTASASGAVPRRRVQEVPPPNASALEAVESCDDLRGYLVDAMVEQLVRAWLGHWRWLDGGPFGGAEGGGQPTDFTTTNNQEAGVDELDIVKTDGSHLYIAMDQKLRVVRSWPAASSELLAELPLEGWTSGLFLRHELLAVLSSGGWVLGDGGYWTPTTRIDLVDVRVKDSPRIVRSIDLEGYLIGARLIDGRMFAVLRTYLPTPQEAWELLWQEDIGLPEVPLDATPAEREAAAAAARPILKPYVERIVAGVSLDDVLPAVVDTGVGSGAAEPRPAFGCSDVYRPLKVGSYGMLAVLHLDLDAAAAGGGEVEGVGLVADGWTVYASSRNLYVANGQSSWWWFDDSEAAASIHKFGLGGEEAPIRYLASGEVPGFLLNQFSMSEHDGLLRAASTEFNVWSAAPEERRGSLVTVLRDDGRGALVRVGQVRDIAPGERIFAARFMGSKGFLVTFEQVDPLFTLDLADPTHPRVVGELVMPGFSAYLHPVDDRYLLAVGRAENPSGQLTEMAVNLFDVGDLAHPKLAHQHVFARGEGEWVWSEALWDHHAFTFHRGVLSVPMSLYSRGRYVSNLAVLDVDAASGIRELGRVNHEDLTPSDGWTCMRRSVYVEEFLFSLSNVGLKASMLRDPANVLAAVPFGRVPRASM